LSFRTIALAAANGSMSLANKPTPQRSKRNR
jgi:hypothetical protein